MLITRRLRLLSPLLAVKHSHKNGKRREFVHINPPAGCDDKLVYVSTQLARWNWAFLEARDALGLDEIAVSAIIPGRYYVVKRTSTYVRLFRRGRIQAREKFEAITSGQVMELKFTLSQHIPPNTDGEGRFSRVPTTDEFDAMLTHIGDNLGMSEWGHAFQYGRFELQPEVFYKKEADAK